MDALPVDMSNPAVQEFLSLVRYVYFLCTLCILTLPDCKC